MMNKAKMLGMSKNTYNTLITKVSMEKLLSHTSAKDELAKYLAEQTIEYAERNGARAVVAYGCDSKGTNRDMSYLKSDQEETTRRSSCMHLTQQLMEQQRQGSTLPTLMCSSLH